MELIKEEKLSFILLKIGIFSLLSGDYSAFSSGNYSKKSEKSDDNDTTISKSRLMSSLT